MQMEATMKTYKSGQLAKAAEVNSETLRYYERENLLPLPDRTESGYRLYTEDDLKRVIFIKRAQELGFSLKEIKELLSLASDKQQSSAAVKLLADQKIQTIEAKITSLQAIKDNLQALSNLCNGEGRIQECPIIKSLDLNLEKGGVNDD